MIVNFDSYNQQEPPVVVVCNPNLEQLYSIGGYIYNTKITKRFNAISEFTFDFPYTIDNGLTTVESYSHIEAKKYILLQNEGYFIIDTAEETSGGEFPVKNVKCRSVEAELINKRFTNFSGTYKFFNLIPISQQITLMDKILELLPTWSAGQIDLTVAAKYRTFDINDTTVYAFLMQDCEKSFECIFDFDTVNKRINVLNVATATTPTDIYLSYDNLILNSTLSELTDEIVTAMSVYGDGTLSIAAVNPMGGNKIYNFAYYKSTNWMTQSLVDAVTAWENVVSSNQTAYAGLLTDFRVKNSELLTLEGELAELQAQYTAKETELKVCIEAKLPTATLKAQLDAIKVLINAKNAQITAKKSEIAVINESLLIINTACSFSTNFTTQQYNELSIFMFENTYQNNTLVVTDLTTPVEYQDTAQELYNQAMSVLGRSSLPRYEFKMDTANFVAMKDFSSFTAELELGCTVTVNMNDRYHIVPVLLEISMSYDDPTQFSLTFSNRLRLDNGNFQYADLVGQVVTTGSTVSGNSQQWSNWDKNYKDSVSQFITSALDSSLNNVINATNQEIVINQNGLRGKMSLAGGGYSPEEMWLTGNTLAFTDDSWETAKLALGKITVNGNSYYGIVGDAISITVIKGKTLCY